MRPREIIIILPYSVPAWDVSYNPIPLRRFIYSVRDMVTQRMVGIKEASFQYLLLLDDDIVFKSDQAIEILFSEMLKYSATLALSYSPEASVFNNYVFWSKYIKGRYRIKIVPKIAFTGT